MLENIEEIIEELEIEYYEIGADYDGIDMEEWIEWRLDKVLR